MTKDKVGSSSPTPLAKRLNPQLPTMTNDWIGGWLVVRGNMWCRLDALLLWSMKFTTSSVNVVSIKIQFNLKGFEFQEKHKSIIIFFLFFTFASFYRSISFYFLSHWVDGCHSNAVRLFDFLRKERSLFAGYPTRMQLLLGCAMSWNEYRNKCEFA